MPPPAESTIIRQHKFIGGEVGENQYGRTDDPRYPFSLKTCLNFLPLQYGSLVNRAGTVNIAQTGGSGSRPRFEKFVFSNDDAVLLEFGNFYVRFYINGTRLETSPGVAYEVATAFALADVMALDMAQSGDVVTITHANYQPYLLTRLTPTTWFVAAKTFGPPAGFIPLTLVIAQRAADNAAGYSGGTLYNPGDYVNNGTATFIAVLSTFGNPPAPWDPAHPWWEIALDPTRMPREWEVVITALYKDSLGRKLESLPSVKASMTAFIGDDRPAKYTWAIPSNPGFSWKLMGYRVYRGRNGLWGWLNDTDPTQTTYRDDGREPNYAIQPPKATNPFKVADGNNTDTTFLFPSTVAYHEGRLVFALFNRFVASKLDNFDNFDTNFPLQDTDMYDYRVSSQKFERIRRIVSLHQLLIFTSESEFSAEGAPGQAITANSIRVRRHSDHGSAQNLKPLIAGTAVLFNTAKGNHIRDFEFDFNRNAFAGSDLTVRARHMFEDHSLVDWDFQEEPYPILWAVRDDGVLVSCTYEPATHTLAWARHTLGGGGAVRRVRCLPEADEDRIYVCSDRFGTHYVERMASRFIDDVRTGVFLDSAVIYDGHPTALGLSGRTMQIDSLDHPGSVDPVDYTAGKRISILSSVAGSFVAGDVGGKRVIFNPDTADSFSADVDEFISSALVNAELKDDLTVAEAALWTASGSGGTLEWGFARIIVTGLGHINGQTVKVLQDGFVQGPFVVAGGVIGPLNPPALLAVAGLPYVSDAELLDVASPTLKTNVKSVLKVIVEVVLSRGLWAGKTFDKIREWRQKRVSQSWEAPPLSTEQVEIVVDGGWETTGRAVFRQVDPLPLTIVAVSREVVLGGR